MFKKWLVILGTVVLFSCSFQLLWGDGGGEENPWHGTTGSGGTTTTSSTGSTAVNSGTSTPLLTRIFIVRPAPMGGFYLIRVSLLSDASAKTAAGGKKAGN